MRSLGFGLVCLLALFVLGSKGVSGAAFIVTITGDVVAADGECSLREAVENASNDYGAHTDCPAGGAVDEIRLSNANYELAGAPLVLMGDITVKGTGMFETNVSGDFLSRVFTVESENNVLIQDLSIIRGLDIDGGGVLHSAGDLTFLRVRFSGNTATNIGGAIYSVGPPNALNLTILDTLVRLSDSATGGAVTYDGEAGPGGALVIDGGTFEQNSGSSGGAISVRQAEVQVNGATFMGNTASGSGGAIAIRNGSLVMTKSQFVQNSGEVAGGAVLGFEDSDLFIEGGSFEGNTAAQWGGAIAVYEGSLDVLEVSFSGNMAGQQGAAIYSAAFTLTVQDSQFEQNDRLTDAGIMGGGIFAFQGTVTVEGSIFDDNHTHPGAGAIAAQAGNGLDFDLTVRESVFSDNFGGGMSLRTEAGGTGTALIDRSTFKGNIQEGAPGVFISSGVDGAIVNSTFSGNIGLFGDIRASDLGTTLTITNVTIVGGANQAFVASHGLVMSASSATVTLRNTVLVNPTVFACSTSTGGTIGGSGNADEDDTCPGGITVVDAGLFPLETPPGFLTPVYLLMEDSPLIDIGDDDFCPAHDQLGHPRPFGEGCDIGAVEFYVNFRAWLPGAARE